MAGFTAPGILALSTWASEERLYMASLLHRLRGAGYTSYHEPSVIAFAMPMVAIDAGWDPSRIHTSDTHLFTSIIGTTAAGRSLDELEIRVDGEPIPFRSDDPIDRAAEAIHVQHLLRMEKRPDVAFWDSIRTTLHDSYGTQVDDLREQLARMLGNLGALEYRAETIWDHLDRVKDDPHAVVVSNPPTYRGAYESFFDTAGRLTWSQPEYEVFDARTDIRRMVEVMEGQKALLVVQQQQSPRNSAHHRPVYARQLSPAQIVYLNSNRPDEVRDIMGGVTAVHKRMPPPAERKWPVLPEDYEVTAETRLEVLDVEGKQADAYRGLWMHRLIPTPGPNNVMMFLDGFAAGVIGYSMSTMIGGYADKWAGHVLLRFAFGAKHDTLRLTRLATMIALQQDTLLLTTPDKIAVYADASQGLVTVEMTRHPEAKGLRGLMTLQDRQKHPDGWKLVYAGDWLPRAAPSAVLADFLDKETRWRNSR